MDRISKTICVDNSRSHRNGLLPFVHNESGSIEFVNSTTINGNYGQYVCDFTVYSGETECARLKYLDVIRAYNFVQEQLRNGVFVRKYSFDENNKCGNETKQGTTTFIFKKDFPERKYKSKYEYIPVDNKNFIEYKDYYVSSLEYDSDFLVLIQHYEEVIEINEKWGSWWEENCGENWEPCVFSGYIVNSAITSDFKFCYDIDTYALGIVEVSYENNYGDRVPNYISYNEIYDKKKWFEENSGITENAYLSLNNDDNSIINLWESMGGGDFYNFLSNIDYFDKYQLNISAATPNGRVFKYEIPTIDLSVNINAEIDIETLYTPYEYSVIDDEIVGAVNAYVAESGSNLTPNFVSGLNITVESQLQSLIDPMAIEASRDIYGSFKYFEPVTESGYTGQMFECTYCTGWSETPEAYFYHSATTFEWEDEKDENEELTGEKILVKSGLSTTSVETKEVPPSADKAYQVCCVEILLHSANTYSASTISGDTTYPDSKHIEYTMSSWTQYGWWKCEKVDENIEDFICSDGEFLSAGTKDKKYRNVTIVSCIDGLVGERKVGDKYYVLARFDNGRIEPDRICSGGTIRSLGIPYIQDKPLNIMSYDNDIIYDMITNINSGITNENGEIIENLIEISYAKGIISGSEQTTGVHYVERATYVPNNLKLVLIDGAYLAELYYDTIDFSKNKQVIYSPEFKLKREVNCATINKMEVGTQWTSGGSVTALLFTREDTDGLQEEPKSEINILYNRGNAAAWENHFKLSECNTMEDLENYGNNFFNL